MGSENVDKQISDDVDMKDELMNSTYIGLDFIDPILAQPMQGNLLMPP